MIDVLSLVLGFLLGAALAALLIWYKFAARDVGISKTDLEAQYVRAEIHAETKNRLSLEAAIQREKGEKIIDLSKEIAGLEQINAHLEEKLNVQKNEILNIQTQFSTGFQNLANQLLEEKSQKFVAENQLQLGSLLMPLREKIQDFEQAIERKFVAETAQSASLKAEVEQLRLLNQQLSVDAQSLVSALRGNNKTQGNWGELQLELLLEKAGLSRNVHFFAQNTYRSEDGQQFRPDFVVHLPENKQIIIDSKVSLVAYEQYFNTSDSASDAAARGRFLRAHVESLRTHMRSLGQKDYASLYSISSPDYVLMFVPIEPALTTVLAEDTTFFTEALERNVVLVSHSTLLATLRTVNFIWKQESQKKNVQEIAYQSGLLYDKFVGFVEDLKQIGSKLEQAQSSYTDALRKLSDGRKPGDTLIGRAEKIRQLGAKTNKRLPIEFLETHDRVLDGDSADGSEPVEENDAPSREELLK
jgi:DNA recombination protein RmuC